jgi:hypothetical protein
MSADAAADRAELERLIRSAHNADAALWAARRALAAAAACPPATPADGEAPLRVKARDLGRRLHAAADRLRLLGYLAECLTDPGGPFSPALTRERQSDTEGEPPCGLHRAPACPTAPPATPRERTLFDPPADDAP